jgi:HPt (histidine-containing phosphotransfer) domain-containing protein
MNSGTGATMEQRTMDMRAYDEVKSIMGEVLKELIETFVDYVPTQLEDLQKAIDENDADLMFGIAHRVKSSCNSLGATGPASTAEIIELLGRENTTEKADQHLSELKQQLEKAIEFLKKELETL